MPLTFFGPDASDDLLSKYDRQTGAWSVPQNGPFWNAIHMAHNDGLTGKGRKIAVIDSHPDTSIPVLADIQTHTYGSEEPDPHGTLVSLLIKTVAPDCEIHHYSVLENGELSEVYVRRAIRDALNREVDYICASLGSEVPMDQGANTVVMDALDRDDFVGAAGHLMSDPIDPPTPKSCPLEPCMCDRIDDLCSDTETVFLAASGNKLNYGSCPARSANVISVGFQTEKRIERDGHETAAWAEPTYDQSAFLDYSLLQFAGALGSSFAAPLFAGALALRTEARPIRDLLRPNDVAAMAQKLEEIAKEDRDADRDVHEKISDPMVRIYNMAWASVGDVGRTNLTPSQALEARLFFANTVVNKALFLLRYVRNVDTLERVMEWMKWAAELMPYSREAAANWANANLSYVHIRAATGLDGPDLERRLTLAEDIYAEMLRVNPNDAVAQAGMSETLSLRFRYEVGALQTS